MTKEERIKAYDDALEQIGKIIEESGAFGDEEGAGSIMVLACNEESNNMHGNVCAPPMEIGQMICDLMEREPLVMKAYMAIKMQYMMDSMLGTEKGEEPEPAKQG